MLGEAQKRFSQIHQNRQFSFQNKLFSQKETKWPILEEALDKQHVDYIDFTLAQHLLKNAPSETIAVLICHLSMAARLGHLCVTIQNNSIEPSIQEIWNISNENQLHDSLKTLILQSSLDLNQETMNQTPLCVYQNRYYLQRFYQLEQTVINTLKPLLKNNESPIAHTHNIVIDCPSLYKEQLQAVSNGISYPFSVIIGGPGTGKTHTAGELLRILWQNLSSKEQSSFKIVLTAPTGKAVANLEASIERALKNLSHLPKIQAKTLHSLLKINKQKTSQSGFCLDADILLIDECSMIDMQLMGKLLESIKPTTRVIMLGDPNQLPPIESGSCFNDIIYILKLSKAPYLSELKTCMRSELKSIVDLAKLINDGDSSSTLNLLLEHNAQHNSLLKYVPLKANDSDKKISAIDLVDYALPYFPHVESIPENPSQLLAEFAHFRLLTPMRQGHFGTEQLNHLFLTAVAKRARSASCFVVPIMITSNDPSLELFNGEMGLLVKFNFDNSQDFALFASKKDPQKMRKFSCFELPFFEYAYCVSVHKSQGSEFQHVLLLLPEGAENFGREAIYTGVTRAKRCLEIWSTPSILQKMIVKKTTRQSGIKDLLLENNLRLKTHN